MQFPSGIAGWESKIATRILELEVAAEINPANQVFEMQMKNLSFDGEGSIKGGSPGP